MPINAALAYQNNKVNTATPTELTLMLYEGAIKFCNIAIAGLEEQNNEKVNNNIIKAEKIITHLRSTLDYKYSVAQDFENIYQYIYNLLLQANIKKDVELLNEALVELRGLKDTWKEVMKQAK